MINDLHMKLLEEELQALRDRLRAGRASVGDVGSLHRITSRMLADGKGGAYEPALTQIHSLLDAVTKTMCSQARLKRFAGELPSG